MYWPAGAPSTYTQDLPRSPLAISYDGVEGPQPLNHEPQQAASLLDDPAQQPSDRENAAATLPSRQEDRDPKTSRARVAIAEPKLGPDSGDGIICMRASRGGSLFATITRDTLTIWQSRPTVIVSSVIRSQSSLEAYGYNISLLMRPDANIIVLHTSRGFLVTYSLTSQPDARAYQLSFVDGERRQARRRSMTQANRQGTKERMSVLDGGRAIPEAIPRFRMVIRIDAGISKALALDNELVVATENPPAIQCIRWSPDKQGNQTSTALLNRMEWLGARSLLADVVYNKPMNLYTWVLKDGRAFAVQRTAPQRKELEPTKTFFEGHEFHKPENDEAIAIRAAINSKFSTIAVGCKDGSLWLYSVRDYSGGISLFRRLLPPVSVTSSGSLTALEYSPDGHCLFAGYEKGWVTWSVFGLPGASTFGLDGVGGGTRQGFDSVADVFWMGGGSELVLCGRHTFDVSIFEFARSALTANFAAANIAQPLLQTSEGLVLYQGHNTPDLTTISADVSLWHQTQVPQSYLDDQWPLRISVVSADGRYLAVAGQRGLAHYSVTSGRWKLFEDRAMQDAFRVRGGMCWHQHILIAAVETSSTFELRLYSRDAALDDSRMIQVVQLNAPAVHMALSGDDSLLVYTHENVLDHYIIVSSKKGIQLVKVGQIGLHGIIRAPARVRAISWIVPDHQLESGDPSRDVAVASVLFLFDGKLVLLQPSTNDDGDLKYDMRVIAHNVEYYMLARDCAALDSTFTGDAPVEENGNGLKSPQESGHSLRDSLWLFDGDAVRVWPEVQTLLESAPSEYGRDIPASIATFVDFYPLSVLLHKGIIFGIEPELATGRDADFTLLRLVARTTLFIPDILRQQIAQFDSPGALHLSNRYQSLPYFAHALEVLLHKVLDDEVENPPTAENALLPGVLSFLSSFPNYLEVVVQCTRKTELRSWRTLFDHLPPAQELFDESLDRGQLKTASGYLLVLHNLDEIHSTSPQVIKLLRAAKQARDWELCKELARFLMALDQSGKTLEEALDLVNISESRRGSLVLPDERANRSHAQANGEASVVTLRSIADVLAAKDS